MSNGEDSKFDKLPGLLPCPFCGAAGAHIAQHDDGFGGTDVGCDQCGAIVDLDLWNRRAPLSAASSNDAVTLLRAAAEQCRHSAETMNKEFNIADTGLAAMAKRIEEFLASPSSERDTFPFKATLRFDDETRVVHGEASAPASHERSKDDAIANASFELQRFFGREGSIYGIKACEEIVRMVIHGLGSASATRRSE